MTNIELYINNRLCDIQTPEEIGIRLNRILINPAELSTKDAQFSYSIILPNTLTNNQLFGYSNVEEVKNKFNIDYSASLIVDGITIFDGKFRMTEISESNYKGNLIIPAQKTVKEIFGDKKMNQVKEWIYDVRKNEEGEIKNLAEIINDANTDTKAPDCIFPYVLYGIPPRVIDKDEKYTPQTQIDDTVRFGIHDFPPSINCLSAIKQIFKLEDGYTIGGNIFNDPRFENLYMSYKNPVNYEQEWHWGHLSKMRIEGTWQNYEPMYNSSGKEEQRDKVSRYEHFFNRNDLGRTIFVANLLHSNMTKINHISDEGMNVVYLKTTEDNPFSENDRDKKIETTNANIVIPISGYYKISLSATLWLNCEKNSSRTSKAYRLISGNYDNAYNKITDKPYEIKLLRDFGKGDFKLETVGLDGSFYAPNLPQKEFKEPNWKNGEVSNPEDFPQYYPVPGKESVMFVDPSQNERLLSGFRFGEVNGEKTNPYQERKGGNNLNEQRCRILAIKHGWSHSAQFSQTTKIFSAVNNQTQIPDESGNNDVRYGYLQYGRKPSKEEEDTGNEEGNGSEIEKEEEGNDHIDWYPSNKFKVEIEGDTQNEVYNHNYGWATSLDLNPNIESSIVDTGKNNWFGGKGKLHQIVWLEKGERITLVTASEKGVSIEARSQYRQEGWTIQKIHFDLEIEAYKNNLEWLAMNNNNSSTAPIKWNDTDTKHNFRKDSIDLAKFLPSDEKIDDWLNNFCNAFNLQLTQDNNNPKSFELNIKQTLEQTTHSVIDLSDKVNIVQRTNQPLALPAVLELGFKINKDEEGYIKSNNDDGSGKLLTGALDGQTIKPNSNFSYNWYKNMNKMKIVEAETMNDKGETTITSKREKEFTMSLPVISHREAWQKNDGPPITAEEYAKLMSKVYTNYAQRFWYRKKSNNEHLFYNLGKIWQQKGVNEADSSAQGKESIEILIPQLSNEYTDGVKQLTLNYKDNPDSILRSYFSLISNNDSNYTEVECYLSPDEYERMNGGSLAKLNSDLYYIAAIEGYDPSYRNKTKLKLIRKV